MACSKHLFSILLVSLLGVAQVIQAATTTTSKGTDFGDKEEGWFWYKDEEPPKKPKPTPTPVVKPLPDKPIASVPEEDRPLSVAWLQKNMDKVRAKAIEDPTEENVRAYMYLQRITLDKAQNFATVAKKVVAEDPYLDENNRIPINGQQRSIVDRQISYAEQKVIDEHVVPKAGLWFFFSSTCSWCHEQARILKMVRDRHPKLLIQGISVDGKPLNGLDLPWRPDTGQANSLGVQMTPTVALLYPPQTYVLVSQGLSPMDDLESNIVKGANRVGMIPGDLQKMLAAYQRGVLTPEDMKDPNLMKNPDDVNEMVRIINEHVRQRY